MNAPAAQSPGRWVDSKEIAIRADGVSDVLTLPGEFTCVDVYTQHNSVFATQGTIIRLMATVGGRLVQHDAVRLREMAGKSGGLILQGRGAVDQWIVRVDNSKVSAASALYKASIVLAVSGHNAASPAMDAERRLRALGFPVWRSGKSAAGQLLLTPDASGELSFPSRLRQYFGHIDAIAPATRTYLQLHRGYTTPVANGVPCVMELSGVAGDTFSVDFRDNVVARSDFDGIQITPETYDMFWTIIASSTPVTLTRDAAVSFSAVWEMWRGDATALVNETV